MCIGSAPSMPAAPAPPPAPAPAPELPDSGVQAAGTDQRDRAIAALGPGSTILTSPEGLSQPADTTAKTLLGS